RIRWKYKRTHKKSLTTKPKVLLPTKQPKPMITSLDPTVKVKEIKQTHHRLPVFLNAFRTFPSSHRSVIKSQRKLQEKSTCELPVLVEVNTRLSSNDMHPLPHRKRSKALGLLRATFHRSNSTGGVLKPVSLSKQEEDSIVVVQVKKRKRDTILGMTRKLSEKIVEQSHKIQEKPSRIKHKFKFEL
ncbi:hypothetical protein CU098_001808, partial [Rhizopus stolonifer]